MKSTAASVSGVWLAGLLFSACAAAVEVNDAARPQMQSAKRAAIAAATRFKYLGEHRGDARHLALGGLRDAEASVVVELSVASVATRREQRLDHKLTSAEHAQAHRAIDAQQAAIEPAIVARGGRIMEHYRDAMNGIRIKIARSEIHGLAQLPGVVDVLPVGKYRLTNVESVPFIGAPAVWQGVPGYKGEGVKIAIIDTGIDYTHADFGGPGTLAAFAAAQATSTQAADPALFGPNAPKVKGGIDLVGDAYDADGADSVPMPDPNPLDCNGHGSHVSGTAAGFGVGGDGSTFYGPYNQAVYGTERFIIGPGVAPNADLYAIRVFGCAGSTEEVVAAIDWAVDHDMDVINLSLGADFGPVDTADAVAVRNATGAGIVVVGSSGNSGPQPYLAGSPASGVAAIGVAAMDSQPYLDDEANPGYRRAAPFSSGGPRYGDSALRPNVTAPGVQIFSAYVGTGNDGVTESGTSMAAPHVSGVAALVHEAHPSWTQDEQRAAIVDTAAPGQLLDFAPRIEGAGLIQPLAATSTQAVVVNGSAVDGRQHGLFFGFEEFAQDYKASREVALRNLGASPMSFKLSVTKVGGSPHTATLSHTSITVDSRSDEYVELALSVPAATVGGTHDADGNDAFREVAGYVTFTPANTATNNGVAMTVPYYLVPRVRSIATAAIPRQPSKTATSAAVIISNSGGAIDTTADFYAWGLVAAPQGLKYFDMRAIGVQSDPVATDDSVLVFAINTWQRFSNVDAGEFDILIDTNDDGSPDFLLATIDEGLYNTGVTADGIPITVLVNLKTGATLDEFYVDAPTDGSSVLMPVLASDLGVTPSAPRFSYSAQAFNNIELTSEVMPGSASFNAFSPAISNGMFVDVPKGKFTSVQFSIDPVEAEQTPYLGLMIMLPENFSGDRQAAIMQVKLP